MSTQLRNWFFRALLRSTEGGYADILDAANDPDAAQTSEFLRERI